MRILIVEDEPAAVRRMRNMIATMGSGAEVVADVPTVSDAVRWFRENQAPDLALFDVQLADGDSFRIFNEVDVPCPVIFTTAYNEHALKAFRVHALDYLLKPINKEDLASAIERAHKLGVVRDHRALAQDPEAEDVNAPVKRFLIRYGEHFKVVEPDGIAYIHSLMKSTFLRTKEGRDLPLDESLDKLERQLDAKKFTRLNRQLIVNIDSIKELTAYSKSRVKVQLNPPYDEDAVVSSERSASFKRWLAGE